MIDFERDPHFKKYYEGKFRTLLEEYLLKYSEPTAYNLARIVALNKCEEYASQILSKEILA